MLPSCCSVWPLLRVRVEGDSMRPTLCAGDTALVRRTRRVRPGRVVVARRPDQPDVLVIKRVWRREGDGWWLEGDNLAASTDSRAFGTVPDAAVIGVVVGRLRARRSSAAPV